MVENCNLRDIRHIGNWFSWVGKRGDDWVQCRLDRSFGNEAWMNRFPRCSVEYLPFGASDHRPIVLKFVLEEEARGRGRFYYDSRWSSKEGVDDVVRRGWFGVSGSHSISITDRLAGCRTELSRWKRTQGLHSGEQTRTLQAALELEMTKLHPNFDTMAVLKENLAKTSAEEEKFWKQKSRESWLKLGDKNTNYFHRSVKGRRLKNKIVMLKDSQGNDCFGEVAKGNVAVEYFDTIFSSSNPSRVEELLDGLPPRVNETMNSRLIAPITAAEIKHAAFSIKGSSAPGFDGFNGAFYTRFWHIVGDTITQDIQRFFQTNTLSPDWNHTQICLIPKKASPSSMVYLRPISLCSVHYKIISKILCDRLKIVLPDLVSETQGAFVQDRLISDNILIAHEVTHALRTDSNFSDEYMAIKSDMSKAYDRVEWCFIESLLRKLGFAEKWIQWVMTCISTVTYSVLLNGRSHGYIRPSRGLRQGDPLSPFLFILGAEALINLMNRSDAAGTLTGIRFSETGPSINHLLFADDSLLVCKANVYESDELLRCLQLYCEASGQLINYQKSSIIFGSQIDDGTKAVIQEKLDIHTEGGEGTYLGLPECFSGSKRKLMSFIHKKLHNRLQGWFSKALSHGGKEILLKSVALALPVYAMTCFRLSQDLCKRLRSAMIEYWWSSGNNKKKISWVAWDKLCRSKENGGLGFHDISLFNQALLCKQAWRLLDLPNSLVSKVMKSRYYADDTHFLCAPISARPSYAWRSILHGRDLLMKGLTRSIGDGCGTYAFIAKWLFEDGPRAPLRSTADADPLLRVVDLINTEDWSWNTALVRHLFVPADAERILQIKISRHVSDSFVWGYTRHGRYTSQSGYKLLVENCPVLNVTAPPLEKALWSKLWKLRTSPKLRHFLWKALHGALAVADRLQTRGVNVPSRCPMCLTGIETIAHLLFTCPSAASIWELSGITTPPGGFSSNSVFLNLHYLVEHLSSNPVDSVEFFWVLWQIWKSRNDLVFQKIKWSPQAVLQKAKDAALEWRSANVIETSSPQPLQRWSPPPPPFLKCNIASSRIGELRYVGVAWILRDNLGQVRFHSRHSFPPIADSLQTDLETFFWTVTSLRELRLDRVLFESSSAQGVAAITNPSLYPAYKVTLDAIKDALQGMADWSLTLTPFHANTIAKRIADSASRDNRLHSYVQASEPSWLHADIMSEAPS